MRHRSHRGMKWFSGIVAAGSLVTLGLSAATPAAASPVIRSAQTEYGMTVVPVTKILGTAHKGHLLELLLANRQEVSIPARDENLVEHQMAQVDYSAMSPAYKTTVNGNCGSSFVQILDKGNGHPIFMNTGFTVKHEAISYGWQVFEASITPGNSWEYTYNAGGALDFDSSWEGFHDSVENPPHGIYEAQVEDGWALLDTGSICVSGDPFVEGAL
jgi:hypothetical protein